jgi:hypothetical protein
MRLNKLGIRRTTGWRHRGGRVAVVRHRVTCILGLMPFWFADRVAVRTCDGCKDTKGYRHAVAVACMGI